MLFEKRQNNGDCGIAGRLVESISSSAIMKGAAEAIAYGTAVKYYE